MKNCPIGVFDSGIGGISVLRNMRADLPREDFIYFGDDKNAPYGTRPEPEILRLAETDADFLLKKNVKAIVIACNTATSAAAAALRGKLSIPVIGMEPALKPASLLPGDGRVLVMATHNTLKLPKFQALMSLYGQNAIPLPCSGLMECVEDGELSGPRVEGLLEGLLLPYRQENIKAVVLGCTHYPFLRQTISRFFSPDVALVDGNLGTVRQLRRRLEQEDLLSAGPGGKVSFFSSLQGGEPIRKMRQMLDMWQAGESK